MKSSAKTTLLISFALALWACARAEDQAAGSPSQGTGGAGPRPTVVGSTTSTNGSPSTASSTTGGAGAPTTGAAGESSTGSGGVGGVPQEVIDNADIVLLYKVDSNQNAASIFTHLYLRNQSDEAFPLGAAEVRYWFDPDGLAYTQASHYQGPNVGSVTLTPQSEADEQYIAITFTADASLPANTSDINSTEFQLKVDAVGGSFDQSNDYSFAPEFTTATEHDKVTVYLAGKLVWGCEPTGNCAGDAGSGGAAGAAGAGGAAGAAGIAD